MVTVGDVYDWVDAIAPFDTQEPWDNSGLLIGHRGRLVGKVLLALDVTEAVVEEAMAENVDLILAHHPVLFRPIRSLCEESAQGRLLCGLVRAGLSVIAAHTNWDKAPEGVNAELAGRLGLRNVQPLPNGRIGELERDMELEDLSQRCSYLLDGETKRFGDALRSVRRVAVCGGAGMDYWREALEAGADAYVTGDIKHHEALDALSEGLACIDAGHVETERFSLNALVKGLQRRSDMVKLPLQFIVSKVSAYG